MADDMESLERVLFRLASIEDATKLQTVVGNLLPRLLGMLKPDMSIEVRAKLIEVLSHVSKRMKESDSFQLPMRELLTCLQGAPAFRVNFIAIYLRMGMPRLLPSDVDEIWPLLVLRSTYPEQLREFLLSSAIASVRHVHVPTEPAARAAKFAGLLSSATDSATLIAALVDTLLYAKPAVPKKDGGVAVSSPVPLPPLPAGMSLSAACHVVGADLCSHAALATAASRLSNDDISSRKRAVIRLAGTGLLGDAAQLRIGLAGLSDTHHEVVSGAEDLLRRASGVDVEEQAIVDELFRFILGSPGSSSDDPEARSPAPLACRLRAVTLCTRSQRAATAFPGTLKVVFECWFGAGSTASSSSTMQPLQFKLQQAGTRLAQMAFQLLPPSALAPLAPLFVQGLMKVLAQATPPEKEDALVSLPSTAADRLLGLLTGSTAASNPGGSGLTAVLESRDANERARTREMAYAAIGTLATRAPAAFVSSVVVPTALFGRLASEEPASRLTVAEALSALSGVYSYRRHASSVSAGIVHPPATESVLEAVRNLLDAHCVHRDARVRLSAVEWASEVFPFSDVRARCTCVRLVGDAKQEVREAARAGLRPYGRAGHRSSRGRFAGSNGGDRGELVGIARRSGPHAARGGSNTSSSMHPATPQGKVSIFSTSEYGDDVDDVDVVAQDDTFVHIARLYPLFQSLVRYCTSLEEVEEEAVLRTIGEVSSSTSNPLPGLVSGSDDDAGENVGLTYVDQPDGSKMPLGRKVTRMSCLSLAALLEMCNTSLDSSAVVAGCSSSEYVLRLDCGSGLTVLHAYRSLLEHGMAVSPAEPDAARLHETAAGCLAQLLFAAPTRLCGVYAARPGWILRWLSDSNAGIRRAMAQVLGTAATALPLTKNTRETGTDTTTVSALLCDLTRVARATDARLVDVKHGAVSALGQLLSRALPRIELADAGNEEIIALRHNISTAVTAIVSQLGHRFVIIREAATGSLTAVGRQAPLPLPEGDLADVREAVSAFAATSQLPSHSMVSLASDVPLTRATIVLQLFALAVGLAVDKEKEREGERGGDSSGEKGSSSTEAAAVCLGSIIAGECRHTSVPSPLALVCLTALLSLSVNKFEQVQFGVGTALVEAAGGPPAVLSAGVVMPGTDAMLAGDAELAVFAAEGSGNGSEAAVSALSARRCRAHERVVELALGHILGTTVQSARPVERAAAAVWLLSLCHSLGRASPVLQARLPSLQAAFSRMLGEKSQFVQECAGKGLAVVYDIAPSGSCVRTGLVVSLLDMFNSGRKVGASVSASVGAGAGVDPAGGTADASDADVVSPTTSTAETPVPAGPAALQLSAAGDAGYRELCAMANEAGQPDLIYRFLALAGHHAAWHARGGAGVGLEALLRTRARTALAPHLAALLPRLFRYQYDPSVRVREPMERLWGLLVRDPKRTVEAHVGPILSELVRASQSSHWRERQAACSGLVDILPGRTYAEVASHLEPLWRACLRAIDDVKDSVREAALGALKGLGRLTLRLADPALTPPSQARATVASVLPFLLADGVTSPVKEAQSACLMYVKDMSKVAGHVLRPHLASLAHTALTALSALEPEQMSYLQVHADAGSTMLGAGLPSREVLEAARLSATRSGPLGDVLDRVMAQVGAMNAYELAGEEVPSAGKVDGPAAEYMRKAEAAAEAADVGECAVKPRTHDSGPSPSLVHGVEEGEEGKGSNPTNAGQGGPLAGLVDVIRTLVRSGVGLPTRGATARFAVSLAGAAAEGIAPHSGPLLRSLAVGLEDSSAVLRKEFGNAAAAVARYARPGPFRKYLDRLLQLSASSEAVTRVTAGQAVLALSRHAQEALAQHSALLLPAAFLASLDPEPGPREVWSDAWEAVTGGGGDAQVRLHASEVVDAVAGALGNSAWVIKRQGAAAVLSLISALLRTGTSSGWGTPGAQALSATSTAACAALLLPASHVPETSLEYTTPADADASVLASSLRVRLLQHLPPLLPPSSADMRAHVRTLLPALLACIPGRAWPGKEDLIVATGALVAHVPSAFDMPARPVLPPPSPPLSTTQSLPLLPVLHILAAQVGRGTASEAYVTAAASALSRACLAHPGVRAWDVVASGIVPLLSRFGRSGQAAILKASARTEGGAGSGSAVEDREGGDAVGIPSPAKSAGPRMHGGRHDEGKEGEERSAARERRGEEARAVAAACVALVTAVPVALIGSISDMSGESATLALGSLVSCMLPNSSSAAPAVQHGSVTALLARTVSVSVETEAEQQRAAWPTLEVLIGAYDSGDGPEDRLCIARALAALAARLQPAVLLSTASRDGAASGTGVGILQGTSLLSRILHAALSRAESEDKYPTLRAGLLGVAAAALQRALALNVLGHVEGPAAGGTASAPALTLRAEVEAINVRVRVLCECARDPRVTETGGAYMHAARAMEKGQ